MIRRGKESPIAFLHIMRLHSGDITHMIRDTKGRGKHGDFNLYWSASRLLLTHILPVTNCIKYVRLNCDLFFEWYMASDAELAILTTMLFTKCTVNGALVWADESTECLVNYARVFLGKRYYKGKDAKIRATIGNLRPLMAARRGG